MEKNVDYSSLFLENESSQADGKNGHAMWLFGLIIKRK